MKYYENYLNKDYKIKNINYNKKNKIPKTSKISKYYIFDPIDKIKFKNKIEILESPNFLLTRDLMEEYRKKTKSFFFHNFYMWAKKKIDIIPNVKSQDKLNRKRFENDIPIPKLPKVKSKYIQEAIKYIQEQFPKNYGNTNKFNYPISHKDAEKWLNSFIKKKFNHFGPYQDFINKENNTMFHSILSSSINIGLINPPEIIEKIKTLKSKIKLNSYEGYIRQLFWREYQRYCYVYFDFTKTNYFNNKKKLSKAWYNGTLNIQPIDDCIKKGFDTAYLHHIERLMLMGNFMNISEISAKEGLKWFMEFSIDSYEWVMHQNVYDMVFFVTGGKTMRRPYVSSSNYILKMSNYKRDTWCDQWDVL